MDRPVPSERDRAVSKVVSAGLLVFVAVVFGASVGLFVYGFVEDTGEDPVLVSIETAFDSGNIVVLHTGGDSLDPESMQVQVTNSTERLTFGGTEGTDSDGFESGDIWRESVNVSGDVSVDVIHEPTNSLLHESEIETANQTDSPGSGP